jgi:hypothetical protein
VQIREGRGGLRTLVGFWRRRRIRNVGALWPGARPFHRVPGRWRWPQHTRSPLSARRATHRTSGSSSWLRGGGGGAGGGRGPSPSRASRWRASSAVVAACAQRIGPAQRGQVSKSAANTCLKSQAQRTMRSSGSRTRARVPSFHACLSLSSRRPSESSSRRSSHLYEIGALCGNCLARRRSEDNPSRFECVRVESDFDWH